MLGQIGWHQVSYLKLRRDLAVPNWHCEKSHEKKKPKHCWALVLMHMIRTMVDICGNPVSSGIHMITH